MQRHVFVATCVAGFLTSAVVVAQSVPAVTLPASPRGLAAIQVGGEWAETEGGREYRNGRWITVDYGRPLLRGRPNIFGSGADYGRVISDGSAVWRAGANATTRLTTQVTLQFGANTVPPGTYNELVDLEGGAWTLVLSNQAVQTQYNPDDKVNLYGSYNYDPTFDLLRAPMTVERSPVTHEQFTIDFVVVGRTGGTMLMAWENTVARIPFVVK
jgi:hypothetical protein